MTNFNAMLLGAKAMASAIAGLFFLRFWLKTRDRLFVVFALAFWLIGLNWLLMVVAQRDELNSPELHLLRLAAFTIILLGIFDKNRSKAKP
jgi:hypothetical protein